MAKPVKREDLPPTPTFKSATKPFLRTLTSILALVVGVALLASVNARAQDGLGPNMVVTWGAVTEQEDGTIIPEGDVGYRVYSAGGIIMCSTGSTACSIALGYSECLTVYATALQTSTMLESQPSNSVEGCTDPKPAVPLIAPEIRVRIGS